jgi:hypothetical protein
MTKETYFEMCDALGNEPVESEIPVELIDFPDEIQDVFSIYYKLRDDWDTMNGIYLGKIYSGILDTLEVYDVEKIDRKFYMEWFGVIDAARSKILAVNRHSK